MFKLLIKSIIATIIACIIWLPIFMLITIVIIYIFLPLQYFNLLSKNVINNSAVIISLIISWVLSFWIAVNFTDLLNIGE
mgnify:CR=1 FL=1